MVLTVTEDTPADMLAGSMELLVQLPRDHHPHTQRVTVLRSTPMMDLLVQIATAHKLTASNYTLQAIGEHGLVLSHHPNTPIGALDVLQVKLLPKQGTHMPRKIKQANQPFEPTFRLQVHLPRNQLYVSRVSPKMNLGEILDEVCREKNLDKNNYELRHPANLEETLDLSLSLQDYHLQEVTLYAKQGKGLGPTLSTQNIMALQRQEERRRQQTKQSVFGFMFKKSQESSLSTDSLGGRSVSPARSDETARSASPLQPPTRPQRKRRPAPKPPVPPVQSTSGDSGKDKMMINHSRNSSDSSGYHEASVLSDNPDLAARLPETLPRRSKAPGMSNISRKLAQTSQSSKSLSNLAMTNETLSRGISSTSLSFTGLRKKRAAPPPPTPRPLSSAISTQALERIVDSEESLTSDMDPSKPASDIGAPSKASSDIECPKTNSDIGISTQSMHELDYELKSETATYDEFDDNIQQNHTVKTNVEACSETDSVNYKLVKADVEVIAPVEVAPKVEQARVVTKRVGEPVPLPKPRKVNTCKGSASEHPKAPKRKVVPPLPPPRTLSMERDRINNLSRANSEHITHETHCCTSNTENTSSLNEDDSVRHIKREGTHSQSKIDSAPSNEDSIGQEEKTLKNNNITIEDLTSLKSNQYLNHKMESNFELHNSNCMESILINSETHFESKDKFLNGDKFTKKERIPDILDNVKDPESLNLCQLLNNEENTGLHSDSTELNVSQKKLLLLERDAIPKEEENNSLQQHDKVKSQNIDSHDENENQGDKSYISLNDDSLNKNIIKSDRMTELKSELKPSYHQSACQRPPRALRKRISSEIEKSIETVKYFHPKNATNGTEIKSDFERNKEMCTVISTIPKCDHFDVIKEDSILNSIIKYSIAENINESCQKFQTDQNEESNNSIKNVKRAKVIRSQSKSDDFEMDILKRQKRYLTSPPEDIAHALNLNLSTRNSISSSASQTEQDQVDAGHCISHARDVDVNERVTDKQDVPSETDILLQKVSDTLSNVLPASSSPVPTSSSPVLETSKTSYTSTSRQANIVANVLDDSTIKSESIGIKDETNEIYKSCIDLPENTLSASTPNMTATALQENTSDYVSAISEDLSISDWEYQLPAPPSAFRDSHSPTFDDYDTVTLGSVEAFKEPLESSVSELAKATNSNNKNIESTKNLLNSSEANFEFQKALSEKTDLVPEAEIDKQIVSKSEKTSAISHKTKANPDLRKEIISELENKIETGTLTQTINKDFDRKNMNSLSAPKIAPVDNTLSNFTITTYTKQNSLDIFEEFEESSGHARKSDDRFIKTFATLSRNKTESYEDKKNMSKNMHLINNTSHDKKMITKSEESNAINLDYKAEPKIRNQSELTHRLHFPNETNEKTNIQRSKSYISISNNAKYQTETPKIDERKHESQVEQKITDIKKSTSITDLNVDVLRGNEKFSQWRDNMLKHQKEPSKEKQLQSLQVLKSILPQLKNAQQAEENMSKEYNNALLAEKRYEPESNEHLIKTNVVPTRSESQDSESECKQLSKEKNVKRYIYTGPPAISLGSWSERPSVNVQIKMDTDYKLGINNTNSNKTIVNINSPKNEKDVANYANNPNENNIIKHEIKVTSSANKNSELTKKLITHTTASGFKMPSSRINTFDSTSKNKDRPFVMGVELKKRDSFIETPKEMPKHSENEIDTSINFKELTNTFGQNMNFKQKPKRNINKNSANNDTQLDKIERSAEPNVKQNGHAQFAKTFNQNDHSSRSRFWTHDIQENSQAKKFTSVVGVNGSQNFRPINPPMPIVKGFKIPITDSKMNNNQIKRNELSTIDGSNESTQASKLPTMPVITGVTLKNASARPKSAPVQLDSRDILLESIRNFGGREKLKSIAERY